MTEHTLAAKGRSTSFVLPAIWIVTALWAAAEAATLGWLMWRVDDLTIGEQPTVLAPADYAELAATFKIVGPVSAVFLVIVPVAIAVAALLAGLRRLSTAYAILAVVLLPLAALDWVIGVG